MSRIHTDRDRGAGAQTATAIPKDGRLHYARSERIQLRVNWLLTSATGSAHGVVHAAWLH
jgi:hypothetical protein